MLRYRRRTASTPVPRRRSLSSHSLLPGLLLASALAFLGGYAPAFAVPIGDLHCNDLNGVPRTPYTIGTPVSVTGVVTAGTGVYASAWTDIFLQDATGGIEVYLSTVPAIFQIGDSMTVNGTIGQFNGTTEVLMTSWTVHASGLPVPVPLDLTCANVTAAGILNGCGTNTRWEPNESRLIRIENVTWSGTWPNPGANGTVILTDGSGTCTMFIDGDTGVGAMPAPIGAFDVVGILKQYDTSSPYTVGYQIVPRFPADIIIPGPRILNGPTVTDLQSDQVTIAWTTDVPANSRIDYGYTDGFELGTVSDPALVTEHALTLSSLEAARVHLFRVQTTGSNGVTTLTGTKYFCTSSGPEASGEIQVFFNKLCDTSLALGTPAQGLMNLPGKLVERINAAQYSIDVCIYSFDLSIVADALIAAKNRGVAVRFVYDDRDGAPYQSQVVRLQQAGITVIDDAYGLNSGNGLMHNKFFIFDHRHGSPDGADDWVWTGSLNLTSQGAYTDAQNVIVFQDAALAAIYTAEFNEMWGSATDVPDPNLSRFGSRKTNDTPKDAIVGGVPVRVWFGPSDGIVSVLRNEISQATASTHFCILAFTRDDVAGDLRNKWYYTPGFELRGVFDSAEGSNPDSEYPDMIGGGSEPWDPPADVWLDVEAGSLHHKYMILDVNQTPLDPTVITGSANWSSNANFDNDENMVVVRDFSIANQYFQEFSSRYHIAGGSGDLTVEVPEAAGVAGGVPILRIAPNPARVGFALRFALPVATDGRVSLHAPDGRLVVDLYRGSLVAGENRLDLSLGAAGVDLPASLYFVRLGAGERVLTSRLIVLR